MAAERWAMVRVTARTRQRLEELRQRFVRSHEKGQRCVDVDYRHDLPSLDWVISELLDVDARHQARAKRQRKAQA